MFIQAKKFHEESHKPLIQKLKNLDKLLVAEIQ